jgi:hypothetical protein
MSEFQIFALFICAMAVAVIVGGMGAAPIVVALIAFGGIYLALRGKYYLVDTYKDASGIDVTVEVAEPAYSTRPIMSVTDYDDTGDDAPNPLAYDDPVRKALEMSVIAANTAEQSRAIKTGRLNALQYNTARLPPDSQVRVADEVNWEPAPVDPKVLEGYADIAGTAFNPPDLDAAEAKERQILATYVPKSSAELGTYSIEDADTLIKKIYKERKQIPTYRKREEDGVYEVYEVKDEDPVIVWEDEVGAPAVAGGANINVPVIPADYSSVDPFYEPLARGKLNRADYTAFTPGLERMFAPTNQTQNWY